jgi:hypothetical protein
MWSTAHRRTGGSARRLLGQWPVVLPLLAVAAGGCSSSGRRDQNYGTDVATAYHPPEGGALLDGAGRDAGVVDAGDAGTGADGSSDGGAADGP